MNLKMKIGMIIIGLGVLSAQAQDAKKMVSDMITAVGGKKNFYSLKNVQYDYEYRNPSAPMTLLNHETHVFRNELSYATYKEHSVSGPNGEKIVEGYDGNEAWVTVNGQLSDDEQLNNMSRFMRKTNFYWFTMFFKLLDPGVNHEFLGNKKVDGKSYDLVKITFGDDVGDAQDTYVLFINKDTGLVDQFLFTVMSFELKDPLLMVMEYETIDGIKIPSKRKYIEADWEGKITGDQWTITNWTNIDFNTEIDTALFQKPEK